MQQQSSGLQEPGNTQQLNEEPGMQENRQLGEEIREGARNEDQLDKMKENIPEGGRDAYPEKQAGTPPSTGDN